MVNLIGVASRRSPSNLRIASWAAATPATRVTRLTAGSAARTAPLGRAMLKHPGGVEHPHQRVDEVPRDLAHLVAVDVLGLRDAELLPYPDRGVEDVKHEGLFLGPAAVPGE